ncbi:HAMP domain-containing histidine kinase [Paenibacillus sp. N1-5-1-14]|uniref:sensor histidine kinase n=1 Tax=Paenibacillus radicibacter TaxID=2972488 RepID=UPI002159559C|nr:HAMP domain-containing sensor histidine kinase [Paenibacillus radicibacter]MCR8643058.1 HAMP domain-containing histidine kinase [Paenibacillus radicibacter]
MLQNILIQFAIITISLYLYEYCFTRLKTYLPRTAPLILGIFCGITTVLCMLLPFYTVGTIIFDLRHIPIIICMFYGGVSPGIIGITIMIIARLLTGGDIVLLVPTSLSILCVFLFIYKAHYQRALPLQRKLIIHISSCIVFLLIVLSCWLYSDFHQIRYDRSEFLIAIGYLFIGSIITLHLCMHYMENMVERMFLRVSIEHSDKMHTISEIAASVAHEVRNPLTVMKGFLQLMKRDAKEQQLKYMDLVLSELDRAEFIITDYLSFAKRSGSDKIEILDISKNIIETTQIMTAYGLMQRVELQIRNEPNLFLLGDHAKFKQILMNVMKNAIEASHYGDIITVTSSCDMERITIKVADTGEGMTKEQLYSIGKAFYSTKTNGTGLGVMVTFRLVEEMGGTIHFDSQMGQGTVVTLSFPIAKPQLATNALTS